MSDVKPLSPTGDGRQFVFVARPVQINSIRGSCKLKEKSARYERSRDKMDASPSSFRPAYILHLPGVPGWLIQVSPTNRAYI